MKHDDGGPAFPRASGPEPRDKSATDYTDGMSLWDWFAGQALAGTLAKDDGLTYEKAAQIACAQADAMIAEKRRREQS